jgi:hypothetical protein
MNQQRYEYEVSSQEWYFEERYRSGTDYALRHDPDYVKWAEDRRAEDLKYQIEHAN